MSNSIGHIYKRGNTWWIKYHVGGEARYESSGSNKREDARDLLRKRLGAPATAKGSVTVGSLLDDLKAYYDASKRADYDASFQHLYKGLGDVRAARLTTAGVNQYVAKRQSVGAAANNTVNRELAILRRAFSFGAESTPPRVASIPRFKLLKPGAARTGFITFEDYNKIKGHLPDWFVGPFVVGFYTGARLEEIFSITHDSVDLAASEIMLKAADTKTGEGRHLPIYGDMVQIVKDAISRRFPGCPYLFHRAGTPLYQGRIWRAWKACVISAGYPNLMFHDLRRSAIRNMVRAGIPEKVAMTVSGHKSRSIFARYNIVDGDDVRRVGETMQRFFGGEKKAL